MKKRIVVVGGGFGGLAVTKSLAKNSKHHITLIDRRNHHLFQPLLYQVATAALSPADIAVPIRSIFSDQQNVDVVLDNIERVDLDSNCIKSQEHQYCYDFLVLACGAKHSYFSNPQWEEFAPGLKTLEQATEIRRRILLAFEKAEMEQDSLIQREWQSFVIVGGGPTGVELAGAIAEISRHTLEGDFRRIDPSRTRVILIEAGSRVLAGFDESLSKKAARDLEKLGVQIWTSTRVTDITKESVSLGSEVLRARTIIWAAGVQSSSISHFLESSQAVSKPTLDRQGRVLVNERLQLEHYSNVFCIGDMASCKDASGKELPGIAPVAMQQGKYVAKVISQWGVGDKTLPVAGSVASFRYFDKGMMATLGRKLAVLQVGQFKMSGILAWCAWLFIHIFYLIGFKNRVFVFLQWAWSYLTFKRGARLIVDKEWRSIPEQKSK